MLVTPLAAIFNFDVTYIFLYIILFAVFIIAGLNTYARSANDQYCLNASICSSVFIAIVGSRYMRGNDYLHYVESYMHGDDLHEFLFTGFNTILREGLSVNGYCIFYIYAVPFIIGAFCFLKKYRYYSKWLIPMFLVSMLYFVEYEIRQAFAFSFIFLFLAEFLTFSHSKLQKILLLCLYSLVAVSLHTVCILFIGLFFIVYYFISKPLDYRITIPVLFFASYLFAEYYDISYLNPILNLISGAGGKFAQYTEGNAAEAWFGESALQLDNARNPIIKVFDFLGNASLFYFISKYPRKAISTKGKVLLTFSNLYIIGNIGRQAFLYLEILSRISCMFQRFWFIPFVIVIRCVNLKKLSNTEKILYFSMSFLFYDILKYLIFPPPGFTLFLWDK